MFARLLTVTHCRLSASPLSCPTFTRAMTTRAPTRLQGEQLNTALRSLSAWKKVNPYIHTAAAASGDKDSIKRTFTFTDFNTAFGFMSRSALLAEKLNHHPAWFNVYNRVEVELETHDCSGLSNNDIEMAKAMDSYAQQLGVKH